ncbi:hypothetical protein COF57_15345 [Bacillus wiedmannii]|uniref:Uncharacterized protein n=1 Tax=Bacillus wiedmannii TaxID=1890302 RepID=A0A2C4Q7Z2_9BACI|nr:hypothetical protein COF57_15345 [Bacillus wiedmannii]
MRVEGYTLSSFNEERRCNHMEFLLQILLEITKTIAREGIVMGFKKLTAKKRKKKTTRLPAKRGKSSKRK